MINQSNKEHSMFIVRNAQGTPAIITNKIIVEPEGVMTWTGFWNGGTAEKLEPGVVIEDWVLWDNHRPAGNPRTNIEVVKVNQVTLKVRAMDTGDVHVIRVDR